MVSDRWPQVTFDVQLRGKKGRDGKELTPGDLWLTGHHINPRKLRLLGELEVLVEGLADG